MLRYLQRSFFCPSLYCVSLVLSFPCAQELLFDFSKHCVYKATSAAAKSLQLCPTLCDPIDGSPPGCSVPGVLQARTLEWVAISFSNAWTWKVKVKSLSHVRLSRPHGLQPTRLLRPWDFPSKSTGVGCHCLLHTRLKGFQIVLSIHSFPCLCWI